MMNCVLRHCVILHIGFLDPGTFHNTYYLPWAFLLFANFELYFFSSEFSIYSLLCCIEFSSEFAFFLLLLFPC